MDMAREMLMGYSIREVRPRGRVWKEQETSERGERLGLVVVASCIETDEELQGM